MCHELIFLFWKTARILQYQVTASEVLGGNGSKTRKDKMVCVILVLCLPGGAKLAWDVVSSAAEKGKE